MIGATGIWTFGRGGITVRTLFLALKKWLFRYRISLNIALAFLLLSASFLLRYPFTVKAASYSLLREFAKGEIYLKTWNWNTLKGTNFVLRYETGDAQVADLVLQTAEEVFNPINEAFNYNQDEQVLLVMYPTKASLNKSFGWDADENAMGVYWAGSIRILSPLAWIEDVEKIEQEFREQGPIAHEYTHLVVDYLTKGNYTRWLTEGVAQYMERELTGFAFPALDTVNREELYSLAEMTSNFDNLPDQSLAYHESLAAVDYYVDRFGFDALVKLLHDLGSGKSLEQALEENSGLNLTSFEALVADYILAGSENNRSN